ncbi:uncharacterized protein LOC133780013 [Humulus lupulus]|uniref:uncharacterized protein LOC133780013 n=1 Tax=Humulus lupulus TaxID=3486 RepID=UPI002B406798|nr:uncharacterized protein LOC133780013 [Humulus lupulus]
MDARLWWEVVQQVHNVNTMDWAGFKQVFNEKYYNSMVLAAKTDEFMILVQGNLSVTDYAQKFDRLAKFAPDLVLTNRVQADRFVRGLKLMIARDMEKVSRGAFTYAQVMEMALTAERSEERIWKKNAARRDANKECLKCTKRHFGECRAKACYKCGKERHIKRNCPLWNQAGNKEEPKKDDKYVPARVFAITQAEADASPSVVSGQIPMANTTCKVLFDSGASHSFISSSLVNHVNVPIELFNVGFETMLPSGEIVISKNWVKVVPLWIDGRELYVDLIVLDLSNFDVILGMNFLSKYGASIDCKCKKVVFAPESGDPFEFEGISKKPRTPIILAMKAREMLQHE